MGLSILGIIIVQLVWINNAIRVKNELFDRTVSEVLDNTVTQLETKKDLNFITTIPQSPKVQWKTKQLPPPPPKPVKIIRDSIAPGQTRVEVKVESNDSLVHVFQFNQSTGVHSSANSFTSHRHDTIYTTTNAIVASTTKHLDSLETMIDTIQHLPPKIKKRIAFKSENLKVFSNKLVTEIATFGQDQVSISDLNKILKKELRNKNLELKYDAAILENDTINEMTEKADSLALLKTKYQTNLFPQSILDQNTRLAIYFPEQNRYIIRSVSWLLLASLILSLVVLLTFTMSVLFMLRQKKISEMKSDFINNMTHEFKTPIATISVAADSIVNQKVIDKPEQIGYYVSMIKKENTRMNRQVEDILTIARLDKKDFEFNWEPQNIHQLIEDAIQGIKIQVEKRGGQISTNLLATNPTVTTDKIHGTNVFHNLLDNAMKYSTGEPKIIVETKNTAKGVVISISDNGIGMSKQVQSKIFERFYRQPSGNIHNVKGFGLGLSYVKAVVEANDGTISIQSEIGKGSKFDVFLPFLKEN